MSNLKHKILGAAAAATLVVGAAVSGATPAQAAQTLTADGCTVTANTPTYSSTYGLLGWSVTVNCPSSGLYQGYATVYEADTLGDDYMYASNYVGWTSWGYRTMGGNGRVWSTEWGNEEFFFVFRYQVKPGGPWRSVTSPQLSVGI